MPVLSTRIVLDCFYLLIFYSEKFSTDVCRLPYAVNVNLNLSIKTRYLGSWCWCRFRFCWGNSCHSYWIWFHGNVSHEKASAALAVLRKNKLACPLLSRLARRERICLQGRITIRPREFPWGPYRANGVPYKGVRRYLVY